MQYYNLKNSLLLSLIFLLACQNTDKTIVKETTIEEVKFDDVQIKKEGAKITAQSFAALSGHLQYQVKNNGIENAIAFCNLNANPIVDSLAKHYHVAIKRTSLQLRNEENKPTNLELTTLNKYQTDFEQGNDLESIVHNQNGETYFFAPIYIMDACTKCHGKANETLNDLAYQKIIELYPNDAATGYNAGDLRGMWSVKF